MITYDKNNGLKKSQIRANIKKLDQYKSSYEKKIEVYQKYLDSLSQDKEFTPKVTRVIKILQVQTQKIDKSIENSRNLLLKEEISKKEISKYNRKYKEISDNFMKNSMIGEEIMADYMEKIPTNPESTETSKEESIIENNDTLLISENLQKVILPYTGEEVIEIVNNEDNDYTSPEEVIEKLFTRPLSSYQFQAVSRYRETMKLATDREKYSFLDSVTLSIEMMKKRFLHPAIITACRSLDELDVYLDCLDKNELDDFKIFKIQYDMYPLVIKKGLFSKNRKYGKHEICNDNFNVINS